MHNKYNEIYFFLYNSRFPRDPDRKRLWEIAVNREEWSATLSSAVCSEHFHAKDFYITVSGLRRLSIEAVPSINISVSRFYILLLLSINFKYLIFH